MKKKEKKEKKTIIKSNNLYKDFRVGDQSISVLKNINLDIYASDFTIIYGPSGCGKSTLLHSMVGLEIPTSGEIQVGDYVMYNYNENQRAYLRNYIFGIIYQTSYWIKSLDILNNVALPLYIRGLSMAESRERAAQAIKTIGLSKYEKYIPTELSGGQQQRIAVARAIVTQPDIIVADEPTGNLDSKAAKEIIELFKMLISQMNKSIIMVTHNMAYLGYATRTIAMKDGRIDEIKDLESISDLISVIDIEQ